MVSDNQPSFSAYPVDTLRIRDIPITWDEGRLREAIRNASSSCTCDLRQAKASHGPDCKFDDDVARLSLVPQNSHTTGRQNRTAVVCFNRRPEYIRKLLNKSGDFASGWLPFHAGNENHLLSVDDAFDGLTPLFDAEDSNIEYVCWNLHVVMMSYVF